MEVMQFSYSTKDHKTHNLPETMNAVPQLGTYLLSLQSYSPFLSSSLLNSHLDANP